MYEERERDNYGNGMYDIQTAICHKRLNNCIKYVGNFHHERCLEFLTDLVDLYM